MRNYPYLKLQKTCALAAAPDFGPTGPPTRSRQGSRSAPLFERGWSHRSALAQRLGSAREVVDLVGTSPVCGATSARKVHAAGRLEWSIEGEV
jgi:hypothetical protein